MTSINIPAGLLLRQIYFFLASHDNGARLTLVVMHVVSQICHVFQSFAHVRQCQ